MGEKSIERLLVFAVLITPLLSAWEVAALLSGALISQTEVLTPPVIKAAKDVVHLLVVLLAVWAFVRGRTLRPSLFGAICVAILVVVLSVANTSGFPSVIFAAGLRWVLPVFSLLVLPMLIRRRDADFLKRPLLVVFCLHLAFQLVQLAVMPTWYGLNELGLSARNPGIFLIPSTAGLFSALVLYFYLFLFNGPIRWLVVTTLVLSITLSASGTALLCAVMMIVVFLSGRRGLVPGLIVALMAAVLALLIAGQLTGRGDDYISESGGTRLGIFFDAVRDAGVVGDAFGAGTNTAVALGMGAILDSMYAAVLVNTGFVGLAVYALGLLALFVHALVRNSPAGLALVLLVAASGATVILSEAFPINILIAVALAAFLREGGAGSAAPAKSSRLFHSQGA